MNNVVYLDYAATTPCDPRVLNEMLPYFSTIFGNPNSLHEFGEKAQDSLNQAREKVQKLINSEFDELVFTSGATESNFLAITRTMKSISKSNKKRFITLKTEHNATLDCVNLLKAEGISAELLNVKKDGMLDLGYLENSIDEYTNLLSVCLVNNETGVLQDIKKIVEICHRRGVLVHIDATQSFGKIDIDVKELDIDFMSVSGHKIYGPKGIGLLFCKKSNMKFLRIPRANPEIEFGVKSGTVPVALCIGMGKAAEIAGVEMKDDLKHVSRLRETFVKGITSQLDEIYINGSLESNYPGIINMSFRGCEGEALMMEANRIAVSSGSACTSNKLSISHVLAAMGVPSDIAQSSLRITIGKLTTESEIEIAIENLIEATKKLRQMSPIWDMIKSGISIDNALERSY
ncbi:MAG: aminotransferase class V-fold PLP-dependent enzyme [Holosporales bacterium]|nr:aminotransferase class V-fold PLP-dependent enzyme [Holosporales bacterium]